MFIILEGPTAAGKSTLLKDIVDTQHSKSTDPVEVMHKGQPEKLTRMWSLNEYVLSVEKWYQPPRAPHIISDRWAWGEVTYAPIYRPDTNKDGYGLLGLAGWRWTEMFLLSRGALTLYVYADSDVLVERLSSRGDDHVTSEAELRDIIARYELAYKVSPTCMVSHNTTHASRASVHAIINIAEMLAEYAEPLTWYPEYIGSSTPKALLVGDKRNEGPNGKYAGMTMLPFMPVNGNSGEYLLKALPESQWATTGLVNGNDIGSRLPGLLEVLGNPVIIALGAQARAAVTKSGVPDELVTTIHHPQYARRFEHKELFGYGMAIADAINGREVGNKWLTK